MDDPERIKAWEEGRTGYPWIDAIMNQVQGNVGGQQAGCIGCQQWSQSLLRAWAQQVGNNALLSLPLLLSSTPSSCAPLAGCTTWRGTAWPASSRVATCGAGERGQDSQALGRKHNCCF